jgi:hypothetical protein
MGALAGGVGGALTVATGGAGLVVAGGLGAAGESTALQYLNTGHVDVTQVAESAVIGGALGGAGSLGRRAGAGEESGAGASCSINSFTAGTPVLMADGSQKPIEQVRKGDRVLATDPESGVSSVETVVTPIVHAGPHTMVDVALSDGSSITATDQHPFWDDTVGAFVNAEDLHTGDKVLTSSGTRLFVKAITVFVAVLIAFNLQIDKIHTYYAGATPVLVHNACGSSAKLGRNMEAQGTARPAESAAHHIVSHTHPKAASSRAVLSKFGVDIDDAANGVFLPRFSSSANSGGAAVHGNLHTNGYYAAVDDVLSAATSRQDVIDGLDGIRGGLLGGSFP